MKLSEVIGLIPGYDPYRDAGDEFVFDEATADRAIRFIEKYTTHTKGILAGKPVILENWQKAIVANLFGWVDCAGLRRYREALVYIPRKNGKTILCACVGNYVFFCDNEPGAEIYCAAAEKDQASLLWNMARQQVHLQRLSVVYVCAREVVRAQVGRSPIYVPVRGDLGEAARKSHFSAQ